MSANQPRLSVLHVILVLGETNGQYNQHCLPLRHERDIAICTYFKPQLEPPPEIRVFAGDGTLRGFFRILRSALSARTYDVVHLHAPQSGALVLFALLAGRGWRRFHSSLVYTVTDSLYDYKPRNKLLTLISLLGYGRLIFCSRSAFESFPRSLRRVIRHKSWVVPNGADVDRLDRTIAGLRRDPEQSSFTITWVGRLEEVKDPFTAISALASVTDTDVRMVMIGTGRLASRVADHVQELGMTQRVVLTGLVPREQVFRHFAEADLFLSSSHGEGLPVSVIEAMAAECPVILSDIPPHRELVAGADFVPLVPIRDVVGFAEEIRRFRKMSVEERADVGQRSREHVLQRNTLPILHSRVEAVYRRTSPPVSVIDFRQ